MNNNQDIATNIINDNFSCVAKMPVVDTEDNFNVDQETARLVANGKQVTVNLDLGYPAQLVSPDTRDNTSYRVCDTRMCVGSDYTLELEFDCKPQPDSIEWVVRMNDRRGQVTLREGERRRGYNVGRFQSVRDTRHPDRYRADITFEQLQQEDADINALHVLRVR